MKLVWALKEAFEEVPGHDGRGAFYLPLTGRMIHIRKKGKRYIATVEDIWIGAAWDYKETSQGKLLEDIKWAFLQELDLQLETHTIVRNFLQGKLDPKKFREMLEKQKALYYEGKC